MLNKFRNVLLASGIAVAGLTAVAPSESSAANLLITSPSILGYVSPAVPLLQGMGLDYLNNDVIGIPHNVVSDQRGPGGAPLFSSGAPQPAGETRPVEGVEDLAPGAYTFVCTLHPNMKGALAVAPVEDPTAEGGTPTPPALPATPDPTSVATPGVVGGVAAPTAITVRAGAVYAASYAQNAVYKLPILANGLLGVATAYATGVNAPLGLAFGPDGTLFVADSHASNRGRTADGRVWAVPAGGGHAPTVGEVVVDGLPNGRHATNNLVVHAGRLYVTNGNATDDGINGGDPEEPLSGTVFSLPLGARGLQISGPADQPAGLEIEAEGLRNVYDLAFRPGTDEAWIPMNGPDTFDPFGEDLLVKADVNGPAPHFGFPDCLYAPAGTAGGTDVGGFSVKENPVTPGTCDAGGAHTLPEALLGLHTSANGLSFTPDGKSLYVSLFGNFFGSSVVGHKVVKVAVDAAGNAGAITDVTSLATTPLDVAWGPFGLYVADFGTGQITLVR